MTGKIFVSYRRDDDPAAAARVKDGLARRFGETSLFLDVDSLHAGLKFDEELARALAASDVFIAIIGARWFDLLKTRTSSKERDYVHEEIAKALERQMVVIPVRVGRDGFLPELPRGDVLPQDLRELSLYQKQDVTHENFARDIDRLSTAITQTRRIRQQGSAGPALRTWWLSIAAAAAAVMLVGSAALYLVRGTVEQTPATTPAVSDVPLPPASTSYDRGGGSTGDSPF
jgi:hypothetical protein